MLAPHAVRAIAAHRRDRRRRRRPRVVRVAFVRHGDYFFVSAPVVPVVLPELGVPLVDGDPVVLPGADDDDEAEDDGVEGEVAEVSAVLLLDDDVGGVVPAVLGVDEGGIEDDDGLLGDEDEVEPVPLAPLPVRSQPVIAVVARARAARAGMSLFMDSPGGVQGGWFPDGEINRRTLHDSCHGACRRTTPRPARCGATYCRWREAFACCSRAMRRRTCRTPRAASTATTGIATALARSVSRCTPAAFRPLAA